VGKTECFARCTIITRPRIHCLSLCALAVKFSLAPLSINSFLNPIRFPGRPPHQRFLYAAESASPANGVTIASSHIPVQSLAQSLRREDWRLTRS
jgi:hypothetical protein